MTKATHQPLELSGMELRDECGPPSTYIGGYQAHQDRRALLAEVKRLRGLLNNQGLPIDHGCDHEWRCTQCGGFADYDETRSTR